MFQSVSCDTTQLFLIRWCWFISYRVWWKNLSSSHSVLAKKSAEFQSLRRLSQHTANCPTPSYHYGQYSVITTGVIHLLLCFCGPMTLLSDQRTDLIDLCLDASQNWKEWRPKSYQISRLAAFTTTSEKNIHVIPIIHWQLPFYPLKTLHPFWRIYKKNPMVPSSHPHLPPFFGHIPTSHSAKLAIQIWLWSQTCQAKSQVTRQMQHHCHVGLWVTFFLWGDFGWKVEKKHHFFLEKSQGLSFLGENYTFGDFYYVSVFLGDVSLACDPSAIIFTK